jgi:hypothetical protein
MHYSILTEAKKKTHTIISTDAEKAFNKIEHPFMIKTVVKLRIGRRYLNIIRLYVINL